MALEVGIGSNNPRSHGRHSFSFLDGGRWMDGLSQQFCIASKASTDHLAIAIAIVPLPSLPSIAPLKFLKARYPGMSYESYVI